MGYYPTERLQAVAFEQITVGVAPAVGLTASKITTTTTMALVAVSTDSIRVRLDGTDPTATVGIPYASGDKFEIWMHPDLTRAKFIRSGTSDAVLDIQYFGTPS